VKTLPPRTRPKDVLLSLGPLRVAVVVVGGLLLGVVSFFVFTAWRGFEGIPTEGFDPARAAAAVDALTAAERDEALRAQLAWIDSLAAKEAENYAEEQQAVEELYDQLAARKPFTSPYAVAPPLPDEMFETYLAIGADASGFLADTIILAMIPAEGGAPIVVQVPRDLYLPNPCLTVYARANTALGGCAGVASGPELVALVLQGFTGVEVDHFARVNFSGFAAVVNALGGVEICVDNEIRDDKSGLHLPAGCSHTDGEQTLAWVRSRNPQILVDGSWESAGGSDFWRQSHQLEILFQLAGRLNDFGSLANFTGVMESAAGAMKLDSGWSIGDAASMAWRFKGIGPDEIVKLTLPVKDHRAGGAAVLIPAAGFNPVLAKVYPAAAR